MTAAIFGLLGVFVGGALTGFVSWVIELSRHRHAARAAARLLGHELQGNLHVLDEAITLAGKLKRNPEAAADKLGELAHIQWKENRRALSRGLRVEDFNVISDAYIHLDEINSAAARFREIAAAETVEKAREKEAPGVVLARSALVVAGQVMPDLAALPGVISAGAAAWNALSGLLREALATASLQRARERTQAALEVTESVAQDSVPRRALQRRRRPHGRSDAASHRAPSADLATSQRIDAPPRREQSDVEIAGPPNNPG
jgi:hypothetical protein